MDDARDTPPGFEALYDASVNFVYSYARARLGPTEGEDVASEVFEAALIALRAGKGQAVTEAWLMAVTRNKVIDRWRASERRMAKRHLLRSADRTDGPEGTAQDDTDRMMLALDVVSPFHRALLVLHYMDGFPMREVAEQLGTSVTAARSGIARARRSLERAYEGVVLNA
jgi:RNA polymerase sigma-70 factor (ECF subfamily)